MAITGAIATYAVVNQPAPSLRTGQIWEATDGCDVQIQHLFSAPITLSGSGRLTASERVHVLSAPADPQLKVVRFLPVRYDELHNTLVPAEIRETPRYQQYLLSVETEYFHKHFKLVKDAA